MHYFGEKMDNVLSVFLVSKGQLMFPPEMLRLHQEWDNCISVYSKKWYTTNFFFLGLGFFILVRSVCVEKMSLNVLGNVCILKYDIHIDNGKVWNLLCLNGNVCLQDFLGHVCGFVPFISKNIYLNVRIIIQVKRMHYDLVLYRLVIL